MSSHDHKKFTVGYRNFFRLQIFEGTFADDVLIMRGKEHTEKIRNME